MTRRRRFDWEPEFDSQEQIADEEDQILTRLPYASDSDRASLLERLKEVTRAKAYYVSTPIPIGNQQERTPTTSGGCKSCLASPCVCEGGKR